MSLLSLSKMFSCSKDVLIFQKGCQFPKMFPLSKDCAWFKKYWHFSNVSWLSRKVLTFQTSKSLTQIGPHKDRNTTAHTHLNQLNAFLIPQSLTMNPLIHPCLAHSCSESPPHRFGGVVPPAPLGVAGVACAWGMGAAVFADVSWLSYVHPAVLAEGLAAVWQLRQGATWG